MRRIMDSFSRGRVVRAFFFLLFSLLLGLPTSFGQAGAGRIAPGPFVVQVVSSRNGKPLGGVEIRLGGRHAVTGLEGKAVFQGVPPGKWPLVVAQAGWNRLEREVDLPPGERKPVKLALVPEVRVLFQGKVVRAGTDHPLAGARLSLVPLQVEAAVQGKADFFSAWDGTFKVYGIPKGIYRLQASSRGFLPWSAKIRVAPGSPPLLVGLKPDKKLFSLEVTLRDAFTKKPVPGGKVTLCEAWPKGILASLETDGAGLARFSKLALGPPLLSDKNGRIGLTSGILQVLGEAPGYEPAFDAIRLERTRRLTLEIYPKRTVPDKEPNDQPGTTQDLPPGTTVLLEAQKPGDRDVFRFRVRHGTRVTLTMGPLPYTMFMNVTDASGKKIFQHWDYGGRKIVCDTFLRPGRYYVSAGPRGSFKPSKASVPLRVERKVALDFHEPNDPGSGGRRIFPGLSYRGYIAWPGDVDVFRFRIDRPTTVRFYCPPRPWTAGLAVLDETGKTAASNWDYGGRPVAVETSLERPGWYSLRVYNQNPGAASTAPYEFSFTAITDLDPPAGGLFRGSETRAMELPPGTLVSRCLSHRGKKDLFSLAPPFPGTLFVEVQGPVTLGASILDPAGKSLASTWDYGGRIFRLSLARPMARPVKIRVNCTSPNAWTPSPYTLRTWFSRGGEEEEGGRNETAATAVPVDLVEPVRGNFDPAGDLDFYSFTLPRPGRLTLMGRSPCTMDLDLLDARGRKIAGTWDYGGRWVRVSAPLLPGLYFIRTRAHSGGREPGQYEIRASLYRAEPGERVPLDRDPPRTLALEKGLSFRADAGDDADRFVFGLPGKGKYRLLFAFPLTMNFTVTDLASGKKVLSTWDYGGFRSYELKASGPSRYRLDLSPRGRNSWSPNPGLAMISASGARPALEDVGGKADPFRPARVTFYRKPVSGFPRAAKVEVDPLGNGNFTLLLPPGGATWTYPEEGVYPARARITGPKGRTVTLPFWVDALGPRERKGVQVRLASPLPGTILDGPRPCLVQAWSYEAPFIREVSAALDGKPAGRAFRPPFTIPVDWASFGPGEHALSVTAVDGRGNRKTVTRKIIVSEYFDLTPADGSVQSGNAVRVRWVSSAFGPAAVRYKPEGTSAWKTVRGQSGRERIVLLRGLEPGKVYLFQPLGSGRPGPVRRVTRIRGLAFGKPLYGGTIARDYDQRISVTVRNQGDKPLAVRLSAELPRDSKLLAAFTGEGAKGKPVTLKPGEERAFVLGLSAQDVIRPLHRFPVRVRSSEGMTDEAEVEVHVRLPRVELTWTEGKKQPGLGRTYILKNQGDTLTDLAVFPASEDVEVFPRLDHGMLEAGKSMSFFVRPRLREGFRSVETEIVARSLDKESRVPFRAALPEGESLYNLTLLPGGGLDRPGRTEEDDLRLARTVAAAWLDPSLVDWSRKQFPQDTDRDGRPDRWQVEDSLNQVLWAGDDTDGDGKVDFVRADLGEDGRADASWVLRKGKWERTNLAEAWLEMKFTIPRNRTIYKKHDLDLVLNGKVVGSLRNTLPEGNYSFRLPPALLSWRGSGGPETNTLEIRSRFQNFAHYAITSDFQVKCRLQGIQAWMPGKNRAEALARLVESDPGLKIHGPDFSVASIDLHILGNVKPKKGDRVKIAGLLRNLGGAYDGIVPVALSRAVPGGEGLELSRTFVRAPAPGGSARFTLSWKAAAGNHSLRVTADPEGTKGDTDKLNNTGILNLFVPGDDSPPELEVQAPEEKKNFTESIVDLRARASDDGGVERVDVRVDGGVFTPLHREKDTFLGKALLQPGSHTLTFRALDGGGNKTEKRISIQVEGELPSLEILSPEPGTEIQTRTAKIVLKVGKDVEVAAARVEGGPWWEFPLEGGRAQGEIPLPFGTCRVEAAVVDSRGRWKKASLELKCSAQAEEGEKIPEPRRMGARKLSDLPGLLLDPLAGPDRVLSEDEIPAFGSGPAGGGEGPQNGQGEEEGGGEGGHFYPCFLGPLPGPSPAPVPAAGSGPPPSVGGSVTVRRHKKDWYCPNRPHIKTHFRLPEYLARLDLSKYKPGSKAYNELERRLLERLRRRGIDTSKFEKFRDLLLRRCGRLEQGGPLPDFWQSLGFKAMPPEDPAALAAWREKMKERTSMFWLRLLASGDPRLIAGGLRARASTLAKFDQALQMQAQACIETIEASQNLAEDVAESGIAVAGVFFPPAAAAGELIDIYTAFSGKRFLTGRQAGLLERFLRGAGTIGVRGLQAVWARSPAFRKAAGGLYRFTAAGGKKAAGFFRRVFPKTTDLAERGIKASVKCLTKERKLAFWKTTKQVEEVGEAFKAGAEGVKAAKRMAKDEAKAKALLRDFEKADDPEVIRKLVRKGQGNKTFQRIINQEGSTAAKVKFNREIKKIYDQADHVTGARLKQVLTQGDDAKLDRIAAELGVDPGVLKKARNKLNAKVAARKEALRKMGVDVEDVTVEPIFITRPRKNIKVGRDRDVTYYVYGRTKDGRKILLGEVDHAVSGPVYKQEFWKSAMGNKDVPRLPDGRPDTRAIDGFADNMDQAVTSSKDLEAYNLGEVGLKDFFDQGNLPPTMTRVEDVKDTIYYKSDHWFKRAARQKDPVLRGKDLVEGMRQSHKQFDDMVIPRLKQYGLDPSVDIPPKLQVGLDTFKQASSGKITPEEAIARLKAIGETPESVARKAADYLEGMEKTAGRTYRIAGTQELRESLARIKKSKVPDWAEQSLRKAKKSLLTGKVSGTTFKDVRSRVFVEKFKELSKTPGGARRWAQWVRKSYEEGLLTLDEAGQLLRNTK